MAGRPDRDSRHLRAGHCWNRGYLRSPGQADVCYRRHAVVDLAQIFQVVPRSEQDRLPPAELERLRSFLAKEGLRLRDGDSAYQKLQELRGMYEPYVRSLSTYLLLPLPEWIAEAEVIDNWKTSAWGRISGFTPTSQTCVDDHA